MSRLDSTYRWWRVLTVVGGLISGVAIFGMMCLIIADVASRNFLGGSIAGSFEIAENYFMPLAVFPALAYVYGSGILPRMDLLMHRFPRRAQAGVIHVLLLLEVCVLSLLVYYTWGYAVDGMERSVSFPAGGSLYTLWPLYFLVPLGFAMVLVEVVFAIVKNFAMGTARLTAAAEEHEEVGL